LKIIGSNGSVAWVFISLLSSSKKKTKEEYFLFSPLLEGGLAGHDGKNINVEPFFWNSCY
jgi:hypothetical protein